MRFKKFLSMILCIVLILCNLLPSFANETDTTLQETTTESKIVEQLKIDLGEEQIKNILSSDEDNIHDEIKNAFNDNFTIEDDTVNAHDDSDIIETTQNEEDAFLSASIEEPEEDTENNETETDLETQKESSQSESSSASESESLFIDESSENYPESSLTENSIDNSESNNEDTNINVINKDISDATATTPSEITDFEETDTANQDIDTILATTSTIDDSLTIKINDANTATLSEINENLFGVAAWMWWYLTDEGHTIHYTNVEPASGGVSISSSGSISYTGLTKTDITRAVFDNAITAQTCRNMFSSFKNLSTIDNLTYLNTSNVTDMGSMFSSCNKLSSVDLSSFNTANVTNMTYMFDNCKSLSSIDLSSFNTANVTDMRSMFNNCENLSSIDLSSFNTANVTDMTYMFSDCTNLLSLDLSNFNTSNVTDMHQMFDYCESLTTLNLSNFDTSNLTSMYWLFAHCYSLDNLNLSSFDTHNVTDMDGMFIDCRSLTNINLSSFDTSSVTDMSSMFSGCHSIENIDISNFNTINVTNMNDMFGSCYSLINIDLSGLNTTNVTNMNGMFGSCINLRSVNLSGLNNSNLTNSSRMFIGCYALSDIDFTNFRTPSLTDMSYMFQECFSLVNLNLSSFDTSNVTDMYMLFADCYKLETINLSSFNTENVSNMSEMFMDCYCLKNLDLSSFNTSSVTNFHSMFSSCYSLTELDLSNFNTSNGLDFKWMFNNCESLTILNLENFQTANGTNFKQMFAGMKNLISLDISNFTISNTAITADFLRSTYNLNTIKISASVSNVINKVLFFGSWRNTLTNTEYTFNSNTGLVTIPTGTSGSYELVSADKYMVYWYIESGNKLHFSKSIPTSNSFNANQIIDELSINERQNLPWVINNIEEAYIDDEITPAYFNWFRAYRNLRTIDISNLNASKLTNFSRSFHNCRRLTDINFGTIDTSNILYTDYMFFYCESLTSIDLSNFNTANLIEASRMFSNCKQLNSFSFQNWNTNKLKKIDYMFGNCESLETVDFAGLTFNITTAQALFWKCKNLQSVDLTTFTNANASSSMFFRCENLQSITCNNAFAKRLSHTGLRGDWQHPASGEIFYASTNTSCTIPSNTTLEGEFTRYTSADRCKIYYNDNFYPSKIVDSGTTITPRLYLDCKPTYQYIGTYTNQGLTDEFDFNTPITTTTHLYDNIEGYGHRIIIYITTGGTQVETIYTHTNVQFDAPTPPTKQNNTFVGWTDSYGGSEIYDFNSEPPYYTLVDNACGGVEYEITTLFVVWDDGTNPTPTPTPTPTPDPDPTPSPTPTPTPTPDVKTLNSISVASTPYTTSYTRGSILNPAGLIIKLIYSDGSIENVAYDNTTKNDFTFNPNLYTELVPHYSNVTVSYGGKSTSFSIFVTENNGGNAPSGGNGGGSGGGGGGNGLPAAGLNPTNNTPTSTQININKTISGIISSNISTWATDPITGKWKLNVTLSDGQVAPANNGFYIVNTITTQTINNVPIQSQSNDTYYFDATGNMVTGWVQTIDNKWYFFENAKTSEEGKMQIGWKQVNGTWYYFGSDGAMYYNTLTPDGFFVDANGAYLQI